MFPDWVSLFGSKDKKMQKPPTNGPQSERSMEEGQKQILEFDATFLANLYSNRAWDDTTGGGASNTKANKNRIPLPKCFSPVYSVGKEPIGDPELRQTPLEVVEMHVERNTPFQWTGKCMDIYLERKIKAYNLIARGMEITLNKDGINAGGHIRVNMAFIRPMKVVQRVVPPPVQKTVNLAESKGKPTPTVKINETILAQNTTEVINIDSKTTARQMIVKVFKNLRMVNLPKEYALYEYVPQIDETAGTLTRKWTRIADDACPLKVVLNWPIPHSGRALVLQEKDRDVQKITDEIDMQNVYSNVTGLKKKQIDVKKTEKSQTGLVETMLSKRDSPVGTPSKEEEFPLWVWFIAVPMGLIMMCALLLALCLPFVVIYNRFIADKNPLEQVNVATEFLQKNCDELLRKLLEEGRK